MQRHQTTSANSSPPFGLVLPDTDSRFPVNDRFPTRLLPAISCVEVHKALSIYAILPFSAVCPDFINRRRNKAGAWRLVRPILSSFSYSFRFSFSFENRWFLLSKPLVFLLGLPPFPPFSRLFLFASILGLATVNTARGRIPFKLGSMSYNA